MHQPTVADDLIREPDRFPFSFSAVSRNGLQAALMQLREKGGYWDEVLPESCCLLRRSRVAPLSAYLFSCPEVGGVPERMR